MKKLLWIVDGPFVKKTLLIGFAGALGAMLRIAIGQIMIKEVGFPITTFIVNIIGTFLLCFIVVGGAKKLSKKIDIQQAITIGFLGSFTTFSALSMETILLVENSQNFLAFTYVGLSILCGFGAGSLGFHFGRKKVRE